MTTPRWAASVCLVWLAFLSGGAPAGEGATFTVNAGDDLQAALDAAQAGDVIFLAPGATFTGNFVLRAKPGAD